MSDKKSISTEARALELLKDPDFFGRVREAVERDGLVGETRNAQATYVTAMSALLKNPLCEMIKGPSGSGKNYIATRALHLLPGSAVREITSFSETALNYSRDFKHRVFYLQERDSSPQGVHQIRTLISEGKLIREITMRNGPELTTQTFVAEGPIAAISTTTRDQLQIDDETRHFSVWTDDSEEQTKRIVERQSSPLPPVTEEDIAPWHESHKLVSSRASVPITLGKWSEIVAKNIYTGDTAVRRYYPALLEAARTIALLRSFQEHPEDYGQDQVITASFVDYTLAYYIFEDAFSGSLNRADEECIGTARAVEMIASTQNGEPVDANQLQKQLGISYDKASAKLRWALEAGSIVQANKPEKNNSKRYLSAERPKFLPDPKVVAKLLNLTKPAQIANPVTGKVMKFSGR